MGFRDQLDNYDFWNEDRRTRNQPVRGTQASISPQSAGKTICIRTLDDSVTTGGQAGLPINPQSVGTYHMLNGIPHPPTVAAVGTPAVVPVGTISSVGLTWDITNQPIDGSLSRIAIFVRVTGQTAWSPYNSIPAGGIGVHAAPAPRYTYSFVFHDLANNGTAGYDFGCAFEDGAGGETLPVTLITSISAQALTIPIGSLPTPGSSTVITLSGTPTLTAYVVGPSLFGVTLGFTAAITPNPSTWISRAEIHATQHGYWNSVACPGIVVGKIPKEAIAAAGTTATAYSVVLSGIPCGMVGGTDLHLVLYDVQGKAYDGGAANIVASLAGGSVPVQTFSPASLPKMPAGAVFTATAVSTTVQNFGAGLTGKALPGSNILASFTFNCTTSPTVDQWAYKFVAYIRVNGTTAWTKINEPTILGIMDGSLAGIYYPITPGYNYDLAATVMDGQGGATPQVTIATNVAVPAADDGGSNPWMGPILGPGHLKGGTGWSTTIPISQQFIGGDSVYDQQPTQSPSGTETIQNANLTSLKGANETTLTPFSRWINIQNDSAFVIANAGTSPNYLAITTPSGTIIPAGGTKYCVIANGASSAPFTFRCLPTESWLISAIVSMTWTSFPANITVAQYVHVNWFGAAGYISTTLAPAITNQSPADLVSSGSVIAPIGAQYGEYCFLLSLSNSSGSPITLSLASMINYFKAGASCKKMPNYDTETYDPANIWARIPLSQLVSSADRRSTTAGIADQAITNAKIQDATILSGKYGLGSITPERMVGGSSGDVGTIFNGLTFKYNRNDTSIQSTITQTAGSDGKYLATGAVTDRVITQAQVSPWHFKGGFGAITDNVSTDNIALGTSWAPNSVNTGGVNQLDNGDFSIAAAANEGANAPANAWLYQAVGAGLTWTSFREVSGYLSLPGPDMVIGLAAAGQSINANSFSYAQVISQPNVKKCKPGDQFTLAANLLFAIQGSLPSGLSAAAQISVDWLDVNSAYLSTTIMFSNTTANTEISTPVQFTAPTGARSYIFYVRCYVNNVNVGATALQAGTYPVYLRASNLVLRKTVNTDTLVDGAVTNPKIVDGAVSGAKIPALGITTGHLADGSATSSKLGLGAVTPERMLGGTPGDNTAIMNGATIVQSRHDAQVLAVQQRNLVKNGNFQLGEATSSGGGWEASGASSYSLAGGYGPLTSEQISTTGVSQGIRQKLTTKPYTTYSVAALIYIYGVASTVGVQVYNNALNTQMITNTQPTGRLGAFYSGASTGATGSSASTVLGNWAVVSGQFASGSETNPYLYIRTLTANNPTFFVMGVMVWEGTKWQDYVDGDVLPNSILTSHLVDSMVTNPKIVDGAVSGAKIPALGITTGHLNDLSVATGKLADTAVSTAKIAALAVTDAKAVFTTSTPVKKQGSVVPGQVSAITLYGFYVGPDAGSYFFVVSNDPLFTGFNDPGTGATPTMTPAPQTYTLQDLDNSTLHSTTLAFYDVYGPFGSGAAKTAYYAFAWDSVNNVVVKVYGALTTPAPQSTVFNAFKDGRLPMTSNMSFTISGHGTSSSTSGSGSASFGGRPVNFS